VHTVQEAKDTGAHPEKPKRTPSNVKKKNNVNTSVAEDGHQQNTHLNMHMNAFCWF
jgi:hypothetical protein